MLPQREQSALSTNLRLANSKRIALDLLRAVHTTGGRRLFQVDCSCRSLLLRGEPLSGLGGTRPRRYRHAGLQRFYSWRSAWRLQFATSGFVPRCFRNSAATTVVYRSGSRIPAVSRRDTDSQRGRPDTCAVRLNIFRRAQTVAAIGATT